jgi:hypothetical protein
MKTRHPISLILVSLLLLLLRPSIGLSAQKLTQDELTFFEGKIRPPLAAHCLECHSAEIGKNQGRFESGFQTRLDQRRRIGCDHRAWRCERKPIGACNELGWGLADASEANAGEGADRRPEAMDCDGRS